MFHGEGAFQKIYTRDISRGYPGKVINFMIYGKPSILHYSDAKDSKKVNYSWTFTNNSKIFMKATLSNCRVSIFQRGLSINSPNFTPRSIGCHCETKRNTDMLYSMHYCVILLIYIELNNVIIKWKLSLSAIDAQKTLDHPSWLNAVIYFGKSAIIQLEMFDPE